MGSSMSYTKSLKKILVGTMALFVVATLAVSVTPALAVDNVISTATTSTVVLGTGDTLTVTNTGSITSGGDAVDVTGGDVAVSITNSGAIVSNSIDIDSSSDISGGIINMLGGTISNINILTSSDISGGITNSGTISTIALFISGDISGGLANSGTISEGISIGNSSDISGGITNDVGSTIASSNYAITVISSDISGGITNNGTILGGTDFNNIGLYIDSSSDITGLIDNRGIITAGEGIRVIDSDLSGGFVNSGTISGTGGIGSAIHFSNGSTNGALIDNSGTITNDGINGAVYMDGFNASGGFNNSGTMSDRTLGAFFMIDSSDIGLGGLDNSGDIDGGVYVGRSSDVSGGITNRSSGIIDGNLYGIMAYTTSDISGGIINESGGVISGLTSGIYILDSNVTGLINNAGTISGATGVLVDTNSDISGGVTNTGSIIGTGGTAISMLGLTAALPININGGTITGDVIDATPNGGFSVVTVGGDFITGGDFDVSDLTVSTTKTLTIDAGDTITLDDMSASAGTFDFTIDSTSSFASIVVSGAGNDVDLTGATVTVSVGTGAISDGAELLIGDGNAQVTGLAGAAGQAATTVTDNSTVIWDFQIADGSQTEVTGSTDNQDLYLIVSQNQPDALTSTSGSTGAATTLLDIARIPLIVHCNK